MDNDETDNLFELITGGGAAPDMRQAARELFSTYEGFVDAGFTPDQAMQFMLTMLAASFKG